ncbi:MAG: glycoside hydrolase family 172 protein [Pirellulaceae bacterium]
MFKRIAVFGLTLVGIFVSSTEAQDQTPIRDLTFFLNRLRTVDHIPELEASHTAMSSTWDRSGGNSDGTDFKNIVKPTADSPGRNILFDATGPGCIHRIFVGVLSEQQAGTRIQVFLDHSPKPLFDMPILEFFSDTEGPFPYPLVFHKSYPGTLFPIPFEKHCLVQLVNEGFGKPDWNNAVWSNYWQIVCTRYPDAANVKSLVWPPSEAEKKEVDFTAQTWLEAESKPPAEPAKWTTDQTVAVEPGKAVSVDLSDAGVVRQMRISTEPATPEVLRGTRMQIRWDGAAKPSVDVPIGHFFGHAYSGHGSWFTSKAAVLGKKPLNDSPYVDYPSAFNSLLLGVTEKDAYCRFPMPFASGAKLTIENQSGKRIESLRVRLDVEPLERIPTNWGRFHATWTESPAATDTTHVFGPQKVPGKVVLQREGQGKYVGVMLTVDWPYESGYWWGEGDWMIWTDEDGWPPSYHGTGSEEYFNSGWCQFDRKAISGFVMLRPGHPTVYSFHLNDGFQFQQNVRVVEEQMGYGPGEKVIRERHPLWTSTAYWYAAQTQSAGSD